MTQRSASFTLLTVLILLSAAALAISLASTARAASGAAPSFGYQTIADLKGVPSAAITSLQLPTATGGDGTLSYSLSPGLPSGLTKSASHLISGTPSGSSGRTHYTWTVTDSDGSAASLSFHMEIYPGFEPYFGSQTIDDKHWLQDVANTSFTLPNTVVNSCGSTTLTCSIEPALPAGVTLDTSTLTVSGTPTVSMSETEYKWRAVNSEGDWDSLYFHITIVDPYPRFSQTIPDQTWTQNQAITDLALPKATGGLGALYYSLTPSLPAGIRQTVPSSVTDPVKLTGTPTGHQTATTYTWTATDTQGYAKGTSFKITIIEDLVPSFPASTPNHSWTQNKAIEAFTLPSATGGDGTLTYALSPALPAGMTMNSSHQVSGTPTGHQAAATYTWKVTDADGDTAQLQFNIAIAEDLFPSFSSTIPDQSWTQNKAIEALTLPTATGGDGTLTYAISPALPAGISKNDSHQVSGTPTGHQTATVYTWKVTDADGDTAQLQFNIAIAEDLVPRFSGSISNHRWTQNKAIEAFTLPSATGGDGALTYTLSPALPAGMSKNASHQISGTPTGHQAAVVYTWKVEDADGDAVQLQFNIQIAEDLAPSFSTTIDDQSWTQRQPITALTLPSATGGDGALTYALSPALPDGVSKNASHEVSGTPTGHQASATYTWKVADADGDAAELTFTITIAADLFPSFGEAIIPNQSWTQQRRITSLTLPEATGGDGTLTYSLSPALPTGITRDETTRVVSGTSSVTQASTDYTWTVTDADGDTAELTFTIKVVTPPDPPPPDSSPDFGSQTIPDQIWTQRQQIASLLLPEARNGNGSLSYSLSPSLPAGTSMNSNHRVSGTPSGYQSATSYTWTATDADGDTADLTFSITVIEDLAPSFSTTISDQSWVQAQQIASLTLPTATGGDGSLTYDLSPALPDGVSKNASHEISGTPLVSQAATSHTWTATDADGDTAELTFSITVTVNSVPNFSTTIDNKSWNEDRQIAAFTLPEATGGDGALTYDLSPALPAGVSRNADRQVSGTPTASQRATSYTWKATDADGDYAQLFFSIVVSASDIKDATPPDSSPDFGFQTIPDQTWTQNQQISPLFLPEARGGDGVLTYSLSPSLPDGTSKNDNHRVSGTPSSYQSAIGYTWTVRDADGDDASLSFTITVNQAEPPPTRVNEEPTVPVVTPPPTPRPEPTPQPNPPAPPPTTSGGPTSGLSAPDAAPSTGPDVAALANVDAEIPGSVGGPAALRPQPEDDTPSVGGPALTESAGGPVSVIPPQAATSDDGAPVAPGTGNGPNPPAAAPEAPASGGGLPSASWLLLLIVILVATTLGYLRVRKWAMM